MDKREEVNPCCTPQKSFDKIVKSLSIDKNVHLSKSFVYSIIGCKMPATATLKCTWQNCWYSVKSLSIVLYRQKRQNFKSLLLVLSIDKKQTKNNLVDNLQKALESILRCFFWLYKRFLCFMIDILKKLFSRKTGFVKYFIEYLQDFTRLLTKILPVLWTYSQECLIFVIYCNIMLLAFAGRYAINKTYLNKGCYISNAG